MDPITLAMGLAQIAPTVIKWITGNDKAADAAEKVIDIAKQVTGTDSGDLALTALRADPAVALEFRKAVMANEADLDKAYLADVQSARARDTEFIKAGFKNNRANVIAAAAFILVIACLVVLVARSDMTGEAKTGVSLILGRALGWVEQVFSFEFGTTRSSTKKDDTINNLTK